LCHRIRSSRLGQLGIWVGAGLSLLVAFVYLHRVIKYRMANPVVVPASAAQTATIIFLHGLGDTGHGWAQTLAALKPPYAKLICPTAPTIAVTLNGGMRMPSWFDLKSLDPSGEEDEAGIKKAADVVRKLIQDEVNAGISSERIILGGFSMGGALALYTGLSAGPQLGGIIGLSCWLPMHKSFPYGGANLQRPPLLQCHGEADPLVHYSFGLMTSQLLKSQLPKYTFKSYPNLGHSSSEQELEDIKIFMKETLPQISTS